MHDERSLAPLFLRFFFKKKIFVVRRKAAIASTGRTRTRGKGGGAGVRSGGKADVTVRGAW